MIVTKHVNSHSSSNTYILSVNDSAVVWIIDPGDADFVLDWLKSENKIPAGLLVSHSHIDHIYGINTIRQCYPDTSVFLSAEGKKGVLSPRLNLSYYHGSSYVVDDYNFIVLDHLDYVPLWGEDVLMKIFYTPGHNEESVSFYVASNLFTGDALLPSVRVYTKFHGGNREQATATIQRILVEFPPETIIRPGHGEDCLLGQCVIVL
jgi:glyoxylase-like metal-dependent hydrolase (beta-lactamase superfamily II)